VKAECDVCCTSANALKVVESLPDWEVLFAPDRNLAAWVARQTAKKIIPWDGYCHVHQNILARDIREKRKTYPEAVVWAHPECRPEVIDLADKVLSTGGMVRAAKETDAREVVIATEAGMVYRLAKENPAKRFYPAHELSFCPNMRKITLAKAVAALEAMAPRVVVDEAVAGRARGAIERMVKL